jgi:hypothetical protein
MIGSVPGRTMKFVNREMKIDQIIGYFNNKKINLIPPFQRGTVWKLPMRQRLVQNMVNGRPIPAVFLYKNASGSQTNYNILDGKQRLESLILFVGNLRPDDMQVANVEHYFYGNHAKSDVNFSIQIDGQGKTFKDLDDSFVRGFKDYAISTIEIDLDDEEASFDEIVKLFIDINQEGVKVNRFDVVKAINKDPLFRQVFGLIGERKEKKKSIYLKPKNGSFAFVLGHLDAIFRLADENSRVNRMWERMTEVALYSRAHQHRAPADILKAFINPSKTTNKRLNKPEMVKLREAFGFLAAAYKTHPSLTKTKLVTDQPQFYTLITTLLSTELLRKYSTEQLGIRILNSARMIDGLSPTPSSLKRAYSGPRISDQAIS